MTRLANPEEILRDATCSNAPEGLTLSANDSTFAVGPWRFDRERSCRFRECAELIGERWEHFLSIRDVERGS